MQTKEGQPATGSPNINVFVIMTTIIIKETIKNKTFEEKQKSLEKFHSTINNRTEDEKRILSEKLSKASLGKTLSEETKRKISESNKGRHL